MLHPAAKISFKMWALGHGWWNKTKWEDGLCWTRSLLPSKGNDEQEETAPDRRKYFKPQACEGVNIQTLKAPAQPKSNLTKTGLEGQGRSSFGEILALKTTGPEFSPEEPCEECWSWWHTLVRHTLVRSRQAGLTGVSCLSGSRTGRDLVSKIKPDSYLNNGIWGWLLFSTYICTHVHPYPHTCVHLHKHE